MAIWQHAWIIVPTTSDFEDIFTVFKNQEPTEYLRASDMFWKDSNSDLDALIKKIDTLLPKASYSSIDIHVWKSYYDNTEDNDCLIDLKEGSINSFELRIDVRYQVNVSRCINFLVDMCAEFGFTLINLKYHHVKPELQELMNDIAQSNSTSFMRDPHAFLDKLNRS